jgi:hypothetical protein
MTGVEKIMAAIEAAENVETPPETLDETVQRLAALRPLEYDTEFATLRRSGWGSESARLMTR